MTTPGKEKALHDFFLISIWIKGLVGVIEGAFILYQCYRYTLTDSVWLILLTALDLVVVFLILHEYRMRKSAGFSARTGPP